MATKILMPKLSDTMEEGVLLKWLKREGETVKQGEIIAEIQSDKADMELEAYDSGVLRKIFIWEGEKGAIGAPLAIIAGKDEDISELLKGTKPSEPPKPVKEGKAEAPQAPTKAAQAAPAAIPALVQQPGDGRHKASPLARRIAKENNIDIASVPGTGPSGRVIKRDLEAVLSGAVKRVAAPAPITPGSSKDVELSPIRRTIAKRMSESKLSAPHFYVTVEIDMEPSMAFREQISNALGLKLSYTDITIKAAASALMLHPMVNSTYLGSSSRQYGYAHIGVAVAMEEGLVTPVLRYCEQKRVDQINAELRTLVEKARNRKLKPEEYQGATFTISNLGMFDVEDFVAIINPPEAAILAVGSIHEKPVVSGGEIRIGHTMKVTLSCDHRVIDGAVAARFLQDFKKFMENPAALAL
jgi:pyruvate dehydrogenase E2 component (dihydrolipoamide acetyltransferase)